MLAFNATKLHYNLTQSSCIITASGCLATSFMEHHETADLFHSPTLVFTRPQRACLASLAAGAGAVLLGVAVAGGPLIAQGHVVSLRNLTVSHRQRPALHHIYIVLLRFLLIAALFNVAIGMPLHEAGHLQQLAAGSVQDSDPRASNAFDGMTPEHSESDGLCTWCAAYAAQETALVLTAVALPSTKAVASTHPQEAAPFVRPNGHWRFSARDPPLSLN